ncbi:hypothetical protein BK130_03620 [Viridibacillus sp. FSL H8-0123]|uniref:hypothetical protein n=1 Tax=Viridibacillus sp. FSL R5-0468 TaxID=2921640 RepID=UPI00097B5B3B|nr:hypothetical protein BK130_03620 [Viridibacillus sp. FSL H8-0123]
MKTLVFETLSSQLSVVITLAFGVLLIVLYPLIHKENRYFAWLSLIRAFSKQPIEEISIFLKQVGMDMEE